MQENGAYAVNYLLRNADFRFFSFGHIDNVDAVDKDVFQAAPEVRCGGQVGQVLLYDTPNVQLQEMKETHSVYGIIK